MSEAGVFEKKPGGFFQAAAGVEKQIVFAGDFDVHAEIVFGLQIADDHVREVMEVDDDFADAEGAQAGKSDFEQRATVDFNESLGTSVGERAEARAETGSENHGFHRGAFIDDPENEERFLTSAGRPFGRSERGRRSRPAPFGMTVGCRWIKKSGRPPRSSRGKRQADPATAKRRAGQAPPLRELTFLGNAKAAERDRGVFTGAFSSCLGSPTQGVARPLQAHSCCASVSLIARRGKRSDAGRRCSRTKPSNS